MAEYTVVKVSARALRVVGDEDAIFVKFGAPNTGPGDGRGVPDDFGWPS